MGPSPFTSEAMASRRFFLPETKREIFLLNGAATRAPNLYRKRAVLYRRSAKMIHITN
jgi:hypothetical protein